MVDQIYNIVGSFLLNHPKLMAALVAYLVVQKVIATVVDSLVSTRAEWDKTPESDDTWYERAFSFVAHVVKFSGRVAAQLSGFRPKPKAEIVQDIK